MHTMHISLHGIFFLFTISQSEISLDPLTKILNGCYMINGHSASLLKLLKYSAQTQCKHHLQDSIFYLHCLHQWQMSLLNMHATYILTYAHTYTESGNYMYLHLHVGTWETNWIFDLSIKIGQQWKNGNITTNNTSHNEVMKSDGRMMWFMEIVLPTDTVRYRCLPCLFFWHVPPFFLLKRNWKWFLKVLNIDTFKPSKVSEEA